MDDGKLITDCRFDDTGSASHAVAHAARFASEKKPHDAIIAMGSAFSAFNVSPLKSVVDQNLELRLEYETWMIEVVFPRAIKGELLSQEEQDAFALYDIPEPMQNLNWVATN